MALFQCIQTSHIWKYRYIFFNEMAEVINKGISKYENFIIIGDFKIDIKVLNSDKYKLEYFCDLSSLPAP